MKKLLALILVLSLGYGVATPWLTMVSIKSAIKDGDSTELARHVDFPALKHSLKSGLTARLAQTTAKIHGNHPLGNILTAAASQTAVKALDSTIDATLTPETLIGLLHNPNKNKRENGDSKSPLASVLPQGEIEHSGTYLGLNSFAWTLKRKGDDETRQLSLLLQRDGWLSWKVSGVVLPSALPD
ncbi:hypothetical protein AGMMS50225_11720 [Betaproteobacteria bacterium]|nr:hypothetical protein AGMMS50225_11720 [Betaproteobacteria bacterium]